MSEFAPPEYVHMPSGLRTIARQRRTGPLEVQSVVMAFDANISLEIHMSARHFYPALKVWKLLH